MEERRKPVGSGKQVFAAGRRKTNWQEQTHQKFQRINWRWNPCPEGTPENSHGFNRGLDRHECVPNGTVEFIIFSRSFGNSLDGARHLNVENAGLFSTVPRDKGIGSLIVCPDLIGLRSSLGTAILICIRSTSESAEWILHRFAFNDILQA